MTWRILAVGKPALAYARVGIDEYAARLVRFGSCELVFLKETRDTARQLIERSQGFHRILLDERGRQFASREFASEIAALENRSISRCALLVGGSDGWDDAMRSQADLLWSLGRMTLQHELALVVALEQIYRAATLRAGLPYHRD